MSWIRTVDYGESVGELREAYDRVAGKRGKIANIMKVQSLNPRAMLAHLDLYMTLMFGRSGLSREEREAIAVVVSAANRCSYCLSHHGEALRRYWKDPETVEKLSSGMEELELTGRLRSMLEYASKLTVEPWSVTEEDVESMRSEGLDDSEILDVNLVVGYFNFVNRTALGLGVRYTPDEVRGYRV